MRVFVAGATGAIGRRLVPLLLEHGHDVHGLTRRRDRAEELRSAGATPIVADVFDRAAIVAAVREARPDAIVHQLTDLPAVLKPNKLAEHYAANNRVRRLGTAHLLDAARAAGVGRVVAQGCAFWYRPDGPAVQGEDAPLFTDAGEPVGEAVRVMAGVERDVLALPEGVVLRYGAFYGPGTWFAPDGDVAAQVRARRYPVVGDGGGVTSFVHVDDAAAATAAALTGPPGVYNVVDDEPAPMRDWLPAYAAALGAQPPRRVPALAVRLVAGRGVAAWLTGQRGADNARAKRHLGWKPRHATWRTGFREALGD